MERIIFHIDVNSAFLSWEACYRIHHLGGTLDLRTIPSAVGGDQSKRHGIILTKSIPAKKYHIKTGEPIVDARRKCPDLVIVPPNYTLYSHASRAMIEILEEYTDTIEKYSVLRATMAIERSDVCLILIDANDGVTEQDTKIAGLAHEAGKACIIVVNKWDMVEKDGNTMDRMREDIRRDLSYMTYAPILFISALTGQRVTRLFELINYVHNQASTRITTGMLNSVLADAQTRVQPPTDKGRRLKIYYMTQVGVKPPHFVIFCNDKKLFHFSYQRYLENQIRSVFGLEGTPIILSIRQKGDDEN